MKILVTGGAGFIGSHIVKALLEDGCIVVVLDRPDAAYLEFVSSKGADVVSGNFLDQNLLKTAILGADAVYHFISTTVPQTAHANIRFDIETNLIGTVNLLNLAKDHGVKTFFFASSGGTVYGVPQDIPIHESHPTNPISSHGVGKLAIEKYIQLFRKMYAIDYRILRMSNAYGERQPITGVQGIIPTAIFKALHHEPIEIWGDGTIIRDFIFIDDIVDAFRKARDYQGPYKLFNIGTGKGYTINDILRMIDEITAGQINVRYNEQRDFDVPVNILNIQRAVQELGWKPKVDITTGLLKCVTYYSMIAAK